MATPTLRADDRLPTYGTYPHTIDKDGVKTVHGKNSAITTAGLIIADVVGAGIMVMPVAISKFGWLLGSILLFLVLALNVHLSIVLWRLKMAFPTARTYCQLASAVVADASAETQWLVKWIVALTQYACLFGMLCVYTLFIGKGLGMASFELRVCLPVWTLIGCICVLPCLSTSRSMGTWESLIFVNISTILGAIMIPLVHMYSLGVDQTRGAESQFGAVAPLSFSNVATALNILSFAFTSQFMVVEIIDEMKDPQEFPDAYLYLSAPFQLVVFTLAGVGGYYFIGDAVTGMVGDNIPFGMTYQMSALMLIAHMLIAFLIKGVVVGRAVHRWFEPASLDSDDVRGWSVWVGITVVVTAGSWFVAQLIPFLEDIMELIGATCTPVICWIVPVTLYGWYASKRDTCHLSRCELVMLALEISFALFVVVIGTYSSTTQIWNKWQTYGAPFSCHCEDLWNTCECSSMHAGMSCAANMTTG